MNWIKSNIRFLEWLGVAILFVILVVFVSLTSAVVVTLFLAALLLDIDQGVPLAVALTLLLLCPILLAVRQRGGAEVLAEWAYYFLAIAVVLQLIDYVKKGDEKQLDPPSAEEG